MAREHKKNEKNDKQMSKGVTKVNTYRFPLLLKHFNIWHVIVISVCLNMELQEK